LLSTNAAQHDDVGRGQRDLSEIGEHQRPAKHQRRPEFSEPDGARGRVLVGNEKHDGSIISAACWCGVFKTTKPPVATPEA